MMTNHPGRAALAALVEGLDGVTPGFPRWIHLIGDRTVYTKDPSDGCRVKAIVRSDAIGLHNKELAHIARCDPDTIRAIAAYVAELECEIERLRARVAELESEIERLRARVAELESEIERARHDALEEAAAVADEWTKHNGFSGIGDKKRFDANDIQRATRTATKLVADDIRALKGKADE